MESEIRRVAGGEQPAHGLTHCSRCHPAFRVENGWPRGVKVNEQTILEALQRSDPGMTVVSAEAVVVRG